MNAKKIMSDPNVPFTVRTLFMTLQVTISRFSAPTYPVAMDSLSKFGLDAIVEGEPKRD